jgi:FdhD protein
MKAIRAGIPILASKAVPTDRTIDLAKQFKLTLICSAHTDSFTIYNNPIAAE